MNKYDSYKFGISALLKNKWTILSGEFIEKLGIKIIQEDKNSEKSKSGKLKLESYLINKQKPITRYGEDACVIDYVWSQVRGKHGFRTYDYEVN